jgi:hypothetical protein
VRLPLPNTDGACVLRRVPNSAIERRTRGDGNQSQDGAFTDALGIPEVPDSYGDMRQSGGDGGPGRNPELLAIRFGNPISDTGETLMNALDESSCSGPHGRTRRTVWTTRMGLRKPVLTCA